MGGIHTAWRGLQKWGLLQHGCCPQESSKETVDQPRKNEEHVSKAGPKMYHCIHRAACFGRNACLFGENKPTALMDNTGEGTLWDWSLGEEI